MSGALVLRGDWSAAIAAAWNKSFEAILEAGRLIIEAKAALEHGEFLQMVGHELPFGPRTAERLMAIARDPKFEKRHIGSHLPAHWRTLDVLRQLTADRFADHVDEGAIHPNMTARDAEKLVLSDKEILEAARRIRADRLEQKREEIYERRRARAPDTDAPGELAALIASRRRFGVIYADPPWAFRTHSDAGQERSASMHYDTMTTEEICALPIGELAAPDCVLFLWMVDWAPLAAMEVMTAWGFYHQTTAFTWVKTRGKGWHMGGGYWTRANPETCWLGTRGNPIRLAADVHQLVLAPVDEHSAKPEEVATRIFRLVDGPYFEAFARWRRPGWTSWGKELPALIEETAPAATTADAGPGAGEDVYVSEDTGPGLEPEGAAEGAEARAHPRDEPAGEAARPASAAPPDDDDFPDMPEILRR